MDVTALPAGMVPAMEGTVAAQLPYGRLLFLIQSGKVKGQRVGKRWFVDLTDLARWKQESGTPIPA